MAVADLEQTKHNIQQLLPQHVFDNGKRQTGGEVISEMAIRNMDSIGFFEKLTLGVIPGSWII